MTLEQIAANIEAEHDASYHDEGCDCFERLLAATRGEPDPRGEHYRWPIYTYGCAEPPQFGPKTLMQHTVELMEARIAESVYATMETTLRYSLVGLDKALD